MAEQGQQSIRIESSQGMGWKQKGMFVGALGLAAALAADKIGFIDIPLPVVNVDTKVKFERGEVENLKIILTGNICPVTVEGEVDTSLTAKQNIQVGIAGFGPTKTLTVMNGRAHIEGAVEACTLGENTKIALIRVVDSETEQAEYGMNITVDGVFAHGARVTNLGQPDTVECGMTGLYEFADMLDDIGEETMCGSLQKLGEQAMEQAICFPAAKAAFKTGFKDTIIGISNQVMQELGEQPIQPEQVTVTIHEEHTTTAATDPEAVAKELIDSKNEQMPDGITFALDSVGCGQTIIQNDAVENDSIKIVSGDKYQVEKVDSVKGE